MLIPDEADWQSVPTVVREVHCKDCLRERACEARVEDPRRTEADEQFEYNEAWAQGLLERGGSRTDRCPRHRRLHRQAIQGLAVAYIDLQTIGEAIPRESPTGPLGGLGPLPGPHRAVPKAPEIPFSKFGMNDVDIREIFRKLSNEDKRVLILKAGTGTGKSTFAPYRLLCPPDGVDFSLTALGPIIVTEPRVQATIGVARYVGERLVMGCPLKECSNLAHGLFNPWSHVDDAVAPRGASCDDDDCQRDHIGDHPGDLYNDCVVSDCGRHIGPGYRVGYQVKGDKNHDEACQLVYITDGTMLNWLRDGRLNRIGTVIVDEAHERSPNIDFIMAYLRASIDRYRHLRVIITSATFDVEFYEDFFGGASRVETMNVLAPKDFGYGAPLFPSESEREILACACERDANERLPHAETSDYAAWVRFPQHWPEHRRYGPRFEDGFQEDLWDTTEKLHKLRADGLVAMTEKWRTSMPELLPQQVIRLANGLDAHGIFGDILAFLPTEQTINTAVDTIREGISTARADVYALLASTEKHDKEAALAPRPRMAKRKIVVATNLAETSLTVSGMRFVVDSGLICQSDWNPLTASGTVPTKPHSQAGIRQRWGRVGRDGPGWVFPLYSRAQFDVLRKNTPPESTRTNLEALVIKAKACGIDRMDQIKWPATHLMNNADKATKDAAAAFDAELSRSTAAVMASGAIDSDEHLTRLGKELDQFVGVGTVALAMAVMYADRLACVPEVASAAYLLERHALRGEAKGPARILLLRSRQWPASWRIEAGHRHTQLGIGCQDDLDLVLRIAAAWDLADPNVRPWEESAVRRRWADSWWLDYDILLSMSIFRHDMLTALSPAMKEDVKRLIDLRLAPRARAVLSRAYGDFLFLPTAEQDIVAMATTDEPRLRGRVESMALHRPGPEAIIAMRRQPGQQRNVPARLDNVFHPLAWAVDDQLTPVDLMCRAAEECSPRVLKHRTDFIPHYLVDWPVGGRFQANGPEVGGVISDARATARAPGFTFPGFDTAHTAERQVIEGGDASADELTGAGATLLDRDVLVVTTDASPGDTEWPSGNPHPEEDPDLLERRQVLDPGDPESSFEVPDDSDEAAELTLDALEEWFPTDRGLPAACVRVIGAQAANRSTGLVCSHYEIDSNGAVTVVCTPDFLASNVTPLAASQGSDLHVGDEFKVLAGSWLKAADDEARILVVADGHRLFYAKPSKAGATAHHAAGAGILKDLETGVGLRAQTVSLARIGITASIDNAVVSAIEGASASVLSKGGELRRRMSATVIAPDDMTPGKIVVRIDALPYVTFAVPMQALTKSLGIPDVDDQVDIELGYTATARLKLTATQAQALTNLLPSYCARVDDGEGNDVELQAKRPIPPRVFQAMVRARSDAGWQRKVSTWFVKSSQLHVRRITIGETEPIVQEVASEDRYVLEPTVVGRVVGAVLVSHGTVGLELSIHDDRDAASPPGLYDPQLNYVDGQYLRTVIRSVDPDTGQFIVAVDKSQNPASVIVMAPPHWAAAIRNLRNGVEARLRADLRLNNGRELTVTPHDPADIDSCPDQIIKLFRSPAATLRLAQRLSGDRIRKALISAQDVSQVLYVIHESARYELTIIAETPQALADATSAAVEALSPAATTMTVPRREDSRMLLRKPAGSSEARIRSLKLRAGVWTAVKRQDDLNWDITGPTVSSVASFVDACGNLIPGLNAGVISAVAPEVIDLASGRTVPTGSECSHYQYELPGSASPSGTLPGEDLLASRHRVTSTRRPEADTDAEVGDISTETLAAIHEALRATRAGATKRVKHAPQGGLGWLLEVGGSIRPDDGASEERVVTDALVMVAMAMKRDHVPLVQIDNFGQMLAAVLNRASVVRTEKLLRNLIDPDVLVHQGLLLKGNTLTLPTVRIKDNSVMGEAATKQTRRRTGRKRRRSTIVQGVVGDDPRPSQ